VKGLTTLAKTALDLGAQEVQLQAWGPSVQKLSSVAFDLAGIDPHRIVVKLPCTLEGTQTAALLRESNIRVTLTGLYAPPQVLVAQAVGAEYAAPYLGRMNDAYGGQEGLNQVVEMQKAIEGCHSRMRLLVASVRDPVEMTRLTGAGCTTFTISPTIAARLFNNPYTIDAADEFEKAAKSNGGEEDLARVSLRDIAAAASRDDATR